MKFDFTADFFTLDNLQPLTLRIAGQSDGDSPGHRRAGRMERPGQGRRQSLGRRSACGSGRAWPRLECPGPPLGSLLIDTDGTAWTILAVTQKKAPLNVWEARCRNLSVVYGLNNVAAVLKATYTKSPGGEALPTWTQILSGIPARFQPVEQDGADPGGRRVAEDNVPRLPGHGHFRPGNPRRAGLGRLPPGGFRRPALPHHAVQRAERIDALPLAVCVLIIEGSEGRAMDRLSSYSSSEG